MSELIFVSSAHMLPAATELIFVSSAHVLIFVSSQVSELDFC